MISLKTLVEQQGMEGQYYDLGMDFFNFERSLESSFETIKTSFQDKLRKKLVGKSVRIKGNKGGPTNKQEKVYTVNVSNVVIDDYIDSYVITLVDNTDKKPKNFVVNTKYKIIILGPATKQSNPEPAQSESEPKTDATQSPTHPPAQPPAKAASKEPQKTQAAPQPRKPLAEGGTYEYNIDDIKRDISNWLPIFLNKPTIDLKNVISGLGKMKDLGHGITNAWFSLNIPVDLLNSTFNINNLKEVLKKMSKPRGNINVEYALDQIKNDKQKVDISIKKSTKDLKYE